MGVKITSGTIGLTGPSVNWTIEPGDEEVARRAILFLEDRRLLFGDRHMEDEGHCVESAIQIRRYLTEELGNARAGEYLAASPRSIRSACRRFVEAAGPHGRNFGGWQQSEFFLALGELRALVGQQLGLLSLKYGIEIEPDLARIVPLDLSGDRE